MKLLQRMYPALFALALTAFSVYALLDTFVIERVYAAASPAEVIATEVVPAAEELTAEELSPAVPAVLNAGTAEPAAPIITDTSYVSEDLTVELSEYRWSDTDIHVAVVRTGGSASLRTAFSEGSYGRNITAATSATAESVGAVLAVNGDNYGSRESGYVIRGGVLYRDRAAKNQEDLVIWSDGSFSIVNESEVTAAELLAQGAREVFSFGPGLISDGEITVVPGEEVGRAKASNPRTAIGLLPDGRLVLAVSDGRTNASEGLSLYELAAFLRSLGVETAYNLDGGGSSTMVFNGEIVNTPTGSRGGHGTGERAVTDIIYFG